jgi:hypothetical protein
MLRAELEIKKRRMIAVVPGMVKQIFSLHCILLRSLKLIFAGRSNNISRR